jgi:hypothetical protein
MIPVHIPQIRMPASRRESPTGLFRQICPLDVTIEPATMEHPLSDHFDKAISRLWERRIFPFGNSNLVVAAIQALDRQPQ